MIFVSYYLWIAPRILLAIFLIYLLRRKLQKQLPIFTVFVVFELIHFSALFAVFLQSPFPAVTYRWRLFLSQLLSSILESAFVYQLANEFIVARSSLASVLPHVL